MAVASILLVGPDCGARAALRTVLATNGLAYLEAESMLDAALVLKHVAVRAVVVDAQGAEPSLDGALGDLCKLPAPKVRLFLASGISGGAIERAKAAEFGVWVLDSPMRSVGDLEAFFLPVLEKCLSAAESDTGCAPAQYTAPDALTAQIREVGGAAHDAEILAASLAHMPGTHLERVQNLAQQLDVAAKSESLTDVRKLARRLRGLVSEVGQDQGPPRLRGGDENPLFDKFEVGPLTDPARVADGAASGSYPSRYPGSPSAGVVPPYRLGHTGAGPMLSSRLAILGESLGVDIHPLDDATDPGARSSHSIIIDVPLDLRECASELVRRVEAFSLVNASPCVLAAPSSKLALCAQVVRSKQVRVVTELDSLDAFCRTAMPPRDPMVRPTRPRALALAVDSGEAILLSRRLKEAELDCVGFADQNKLFTLLESHRPHVLLLDARLPGVSGPDWVRIIRAIPRHAALGIALLSDSAGTNTRAFFHSAGADAVLERPFMWPELLATVKGLALRRARKDDEGERDSDTGLATAGHWTRALQEKILNSDAGQTATAVYVEVPLPAYGSAANGAELAQAALWMAGRYAEVTFGGKSLLGWTPGRGLLAATTEPAAPEFTAARIRGYQQRLGALAPWRGLAVSKWRRGVVTFVAGVADAGEIAASLLQVADATSPPLSKHDHAAFS